MKKEVVLIVRMSSLSSPQLASFKSGNSPEDGRGRAFPCLQRSRASLLRAEAWQRWWLASAALVFTAGPGSHPGPVSLHGSWSLMALQEKQELTTQGWNLQPGGRLLIGSASFPEHSLYFWGIWKGESGAERQTAFTHWPFDTRDYIAWEPSGICASHLTDL